MFTKTETPKTETTLDAGVDPWPACNHQTAPARTDGQSPADPPVGWHRLQARTRGLVGLAGLTVLAEHPKKTSPADIAWLAHRLRERLQTDAKVAADLGQPGVVMFSMLVTVVRKLQARGAMLEELRARQAELGRAIATLERVAR